MLALCTMGKAAKSSCTGLWSLLTIMGLLLGKTPTFLNMQNCFAVFSFHCTHSIICCIPNQFTNSASQSSSLCKFVLYCHAFIPSLFIPVGWSSSFVISALEVSYQELSATLLISFGGDMRSIKQQICVKNQVDWPFCVYPTCLPANIMISRTLSERVHFLCIIICL